MKLYKYFASSRWEFLRSFLVRYSQPKVFNDPFELEPCVTEIGIPEQATDSFDAMFVTGVIGWDEVSRERYGGVSFEELKEIAASRPEFWGPTATAEENSEIWRTALRDLAESVGIFSLTEVPDSLLMWAHYAEDHRGFVVEFDCEHPSFTRSVKNNQEFGTLRRVQYSNERPKRSFFQLTGLEVLFTKSKEWEYEREWRIVRKLEDASTAVTSGTSSVYLFQVPPESIRSIILGCRMPADTKDSIAQAVSRNPQLSSLTLLAAKLHEREFSLNFEEVGF
jgi:DUF2971 family protein